jgi:2'-5' RNA ligase
MLEERLINRFNTLTVGIHPTQVELNGFGSFPSHTVYINVASKQTLQNLSKELLAARQLMTLNKEFKPHFIKDPHFIIARKLLPWQYEKGWLHLSNQHFTGRFIAAEMALLKKPLLKSSANTDTKNNFQVVKRFEFRSLPVTSTQGNLFA